MTSRVTRLEGAWNRREESILLATAERFREEQAGRRSDEPVVYGRDTNGSTLDVVCWWTETRGVVARVERARCVLDSPADR